jgi:hypothetical protein
VAKCDTVSLVGRGGGKRLVNFGMYGSGEQGNEVGRQLINEGTSIGQAALRTLQGHPPESCCDGDLQQRSQA